MIIRDNKIPPHTHTTLMPYDLSIGWELYCDWLNKMLNLLGSVMGFNLEFKMANLISHNSYRIAVG